MTAFAETTTGAVTASSSGILLDAGSSWLPEMVGAIITATTSANTYQIAQYNSASTAYVRPGQDASTDSGDTFTVSAGNYALPDDFGGLASRLMYSTSYLSPKPPGIEITNEARIRALRQGSVNTTGRPYLAAVRPMSAVDADAFSRQMIMSAPVSTHFGQRFQLLLYPEPSSSYTLSFRYTALIHAPSTSNEYPPGGMKLGSVLIQACRAVAELRVHETKNVEWAHFLELLQAAQAADREAYAAESYGISTDGESGYRSERCTGVTYNGTQY
jgi:hypothetical protein